MRLIMSRMDKKTLISYSFYFQGDYNKIIYAINNKISVPSFDIENVITVLDPIYPKCLLNLKDPPFVLYYKGNLDLLNKQAIGIVGSRNACSYALKATEKLVLNNYDKVIISGLAKGIDAQAHKYASKTIGILGCGIDYIYPYCNYELIKKVEKQGLILSEYPSMTKPYSKHFPFRNRIIAALSDIVYIMQSSNKSGTMTTVNEALELGKEIRVLPYDVFNNFGENNNQLIYEGAQPIINKEIAF